jgi:membrane-associated protease RseP (regulator of RpoE activity)
VITINLSTIIHEFGHFVMAKLTGYSFVSFRIITV